MFVSGEQARGNERTYPGEMTFTRMGARSTARPRVRLSVAPATPAAIDHVGRGFIMTEPQGTN